MLGDVTQPPRRPVPLLGEVQLGERAAMATKQLFQRFAEDDTFPRAVREMRTKLENAAEKSFKTSPGATYDIDFLSSFLLVRHGVRNKQGSLRDRLWSR